MSESRPAPPPGLPEDTAPADQLPVPEELQDVLGARLGEANG